MEKLSPREKEVRSNISEEEAIRRIRNYGAEPDLDNKNFDIYDQLLACEAVAEAQEENQENGSVIVSGNDGYKKDVKSELNWYKSELISKLKECTSETPPIEIAQLLEEIFKAWPPTKETHWLWIAQTHTARTLRWVMSATVKKYLRGGIRKTPPAYFVFLLKHRKPRKEFRRKEFRATNDTY